MGALLAGVVLAGCGSSNSGGGTTGATTTSPAPTSPAPASESPPCAWQCRAGPTVALADGYQIRLWLGTDQLNYRSHPVLELERSGEPVQRWVSPQGDGWGGSLTCLAHAPTPHCVLTDSAGMHASVAETVLLQGGHLVHPSGAEVTADSPGTRAVDLDGDGWLDVVDVTNDYKPNYAEGHNYWQTARYDDGHFVVTGCEPQQRSAPVPTHLLSGSCPPI